MHRFPLDDELGVQAYECQQKVHKQQKELEILIQNIDTTREINEKEEKDLEENKKELKNIENKLFQTEKNNRDLLREIESLTLLNRQLSNSERNIENHINVNRRRVEKTKLEKNKLMTEKARQDYMVHSLNEAIWKQESELETLSYQQRVREKELEDLEGNVAVGNTTIAALQSEYRGLMHAWKTVVIAIGNRDKGLEILQQDLAKLQEKHKTMITQIVQIRKFTKNEMLANESSTLTKKRILGEIKATKADLAVQLEKKTVLENQMVTLQSILDQTEQDLKILEDDVKQKQLAAESVMKTYNLVYMKKTNLEEEILKYVQSELTHNRMGNKVKNLMEQSRKKRIEVQFLQSKLQNKYSLFETEAEYHKCKNEEMMQVDKDLKEQFINLEKELKILQKNKEKFEFRYRKKERYLGALKDKIELIVEKNAGELTTKEESKLMELEKSIEEIKGTIKILQIVWLREQNNILAISAERQDQIHNINLLKKQLLILEQKNIRISEEIDEIKNQEAKVKHNINILTNKSMILCNQVFKEKNKRNDLDQSNTLLQTTYETRLRDAELQLLQIAAEITDIEEDKVTLSKELVDINREVMEWEKNYMIAKETLATLKEAKGTGGELSSMKLEIHKMEVILGQLKKAQDKLLKDLEHCICRRENIFFTSQAIQSKDCSKRSDPGEKIRMNFARKLDNIKNQIKQTRNDVAAIKKKIELQEKKKQTMFKKIQHFQEQITFYKGKISGCEADLEETKMNREFKFELLVLNQRKAYMYKQIIKKRKPYVIYKQQDLAYEFQKAKSTNGLLVKIIKTLKEDYPDKKNLFIRIENLLGLVSLCMYV
ncbi:coiled-coil domain-containing protein 40-like isoform X2 [Diorhabda carinulata]|uniref:coiled-coil domain-containing protein 40-like isoform X2 n=1 Tax=Diorhabda carinulata TaxID=1163345 RepID=UPI0025A1EA93|nr:coiled-coil domain-containing protein 40-like isoform X2 [Diorhabda carinulata]